MAFARGRYVRSSELSSLVQKRENEHALLLARKAAFNAEQAKGQMKPLPLEAPRRPYENGNVHVVQAAARAEPQAFRYGFGCGGKDDKFNLIPLQPPKFGRKRVSSLQSMDGHVVSGALLVADVPTPRRGGQLPPLAGQVPSAPREAAAESQPRAAPSKSSSPPDSKRSNAAVAPLGLSIAFGAAQAAAAQSSAVKGMKEPPRVAPVMPARPEGAKPPLEPLPPSGRIPRYHHTGHTKSPEPRPPPGSSTRPVPAPLQPITSNAIVLPFPVTPGKDESWTGKTRKIANFALDAESPPRASARPPLIPIAPAYRRR